MGNGLIYGRFRLVGAVLQFEVDTDNLEGKDGARSFELEVPEHLLLLLRLKNAEVHQWIMTNRD